MPKISSGEECSAGPRLATFADPAFGLFQAILALGREIARFPPGGERAEQFPELRPRLDAQLGQVAALERELDRFPFLGQGEQRLEAREVAGARHRQQGAVDVKLAVEAMQ